MYWKYWKRGWWSWLMQLCQNLICMVLFLPLAFIFADNQPIYLLSAGVVALVAILPLAGWLFEVFASKSERIGKDNTGSIAEQPAAQVQSEDAPSD